MLQDLRFALRLLNRHRGYAATAVLTMALGVGANTAVFSVADSVLFRPLPFPAADRLFALRIANPVTGQAYGSLPGNLVDAATATGLFDRVAFVSGSPDRVYVHRAEGLDALSLVPVSREFIDVLGVRPSAGRTFDRSDAGTRAVLLSHRTWMRRYGGDRAILDGELPGVVRSMRAAPGAVEPAVRVVGILPPLQRLPMFSSEDGLILSDEAPGGAGRVYPPLVRLREGVTPAAAQAQVGALQGSEIVAGKSALRLVPLREELAARQDSGLWLLVIAAALVLLVACANLANLLVARGSARTRELAVRAALGASRTRLVRLLLAEASIVAMAGGAAGVLAGYAGFRVLAAALPPLLATIAVPVFDA